MSDSTRVSLIKALEEKSVEDEQVKNFLVESLYGLDGVEAEKRKRGRPRKDDATFNVSRNSMARDTMKELRKERARKADRLNPQPTEELQRLQDLNAEIREAEWDMADLPDSREDAVAMLADIDNLREEAGLDRLDDSFAPYAEYRQNWNSYYAVKKEAKELLTAVKRSMGNRDTQKAEELLTVLKDNIKKLESVYPTVREAYEKVCSELMSIAETRDDWRGSANPAATPTAKYGFGMMDGENAKRYQKRMRSIGKGNEIPKTIKDIDDRVAQTERRWRSIAGLSPSEFSTIKENWQKSWRMLSGKMAVASNMKIADLNKILGGSFGEKKRGRKPDIEKMGLLSDMGDDFVKGIGDSTFGEGSEVRYGILHTLNPKDGDNDIGGEYGTIVVRWKPQSVVATILLGNSLDIASGSGNGMSPSLFTEPSPCSFAPENRDMIEALRNGVVEFSLDSLCKMASIPYVEVQLHGVGKYNASDIESISFGSEDDYMNMSAIGDSIVDEFEIPLYIGGKPIETEEEEEQEEGEEPQEQLGAMQGEQA